MLDTGEPLRGVEIAVASPSDPAVSEHALLGLFPITDPEGGVRSVGGVVVDISETKHAERELAENKDFLERVLGVTPEVIYIFDIVEQRNVFSNRQMLDLLGYSPEEIAEMGSDVLPRILHPDDRDVIVAHHRRAVDLEDGEVLEVEYRMRRPDGEWRILHGRDTVFARDERGLVTQLIGTAQDVTDQREAEGLARQLGERLEATVMASPLAMVAIGEERVVRLWNPAAEAIFGWAAEEVVGRPLPIIPEDSLAKVDTLQRRVDAGEQFAGLDFLCLRKDGRGIHTSVSLALMRDAAGVPESALMILEDVTERRANVVRLARLTRLYQMLSAVTEAIPEEREPARLHARVCGIVVEQGGFVGAWVGSRRRNGLVHVVASIAADGEGDAAAGGEGDRFSNVGVALAEGRSVACRDIAADLKMKAVAAEAEARGVRSVAAVPIYVDGRHDTALVVYSGEPGRFDDEELQLLERLAGDVGFAIEAAGKERARRKAERQLETLNREPRAARARAHGRARGRQRRARGLQLLGVARPARAAARASTASAWPCWRTTATRLDDEAADYLRAHPRRRAAHGRS